MIELMRIKSKKLNDSLDELMKSKISTNFYFLWKVNNKIKKFEIYITYYDKWEIYLYNLNIIWEWAFGT